MSPPDISHRVAKSCRQSCTRKPTIPAAAHAVACARDRGLPPCLPPSLPRRPHVQPHVGRRLQHAAQLPVRSLRGPAQLPDQRKRASADRQAGCACRLHSASCRMIPARPQPCSASPLKRPSRSAQTPCSHSAAAGCQHRRAAKRFASSLADWAWQLEELQGKLAAFDSGSSSHGVLEARRLLAAAGKPDVVSMLAQAVAGG